MNNEYYLNADEIKEFDNIKADKKANAETLKIAMTFHSNRAGQLELSTEKLWTSFREKMGIAIEDWGSKDITLAIQIKNGAVVAVVKSCVDREE